MSMKLSAKSLARIGILAALYAVLTVALAPLSYGSVQIRLSEVMMLLCFFGSEYCAAMTLGCAVSNMFSSFALLDVPFGTLATLLSAIMIYRAKHFALSSLYPVLFNGLIVGGVVAYSFGLPYPATALSVAAGEFAAVTLIGVPVIKMLMKNTMFTRAVCPQNPKKNT